MIIVPVTTRRSLQCLLIALPLLLMYESAFAGGSFDVGVGITNFDAHYSLEQTDTTLHADENFTLYGAVLAYNIRAARFGENMSIGIEPSMFYGNDGETSHGQLMALATLKYGTDATDISSQRFGATLGFGASIGVVHRESEGKEYSNLHLMLEGNMAIGSDKWRMIKLRLIKNITPGNSINKETMVFTTFHSIGLYVMVGINRI